MISSPRNDFISFLNQKETSVFHCYCLLDPHATLILDLSLLVFVNNVVKIDLSILYRLSQDHLVLIWGFGALSVVIPAPRKDFAFAVDYHRMSLSSSNGHDRAVRISALRHTLDPLARPWMGVNLRQINSNTQIDHSAKEMDLLD